MKFLLDMPVPPALADWLRGRGHDAVHASSVGLERATDRELLDRAAAEARVVITADTDFPQLLALSHETAPGIILFRGGDYTRRQMEDLLGRVLDRLPEATLSRSICVVDRRGIRHRLLPLR